VYQAGTLSGNPLATAAGRKVLSLLDDAAYLQLIATATALADGLRGAFSAAGLEIVVPQVGPLVGLFFGSHLPINADEAKVAVNTGRYPEFFHGMLDRGIALAPGPYEVMFPSLAHSAEDIEVTISAAAEVAQMMAAH